MAIDFSQLTKEQKQYIALGILFAVILVVVLYTVLSGMGGSDDKKKGGVKEDIPLEELENEVHEAELSVKRERRMLQKYSDIMAAIDALRPNLPDQVNPYSWVTERVYNRSRETGVEIESVNETYRSQPENSPYRIYAVKINALASYDKMIEFIRQFEEENPLLRVTEISVNGVGSSPELHRITLMFEWPADLNIQIYNAETAEVGSDVK